MARFLTDVFESVRFLIELLKDVAHETVLKPRTDSGSEPTRGASFRIG